MYNYTNPKVFISYSWKDKDSVVKIDKDLGAIGLSLIRDIRDIKDYDNLKLYMKRIKSADYAIIVLSDSFLKSPNCLFEIIELMRDDDYSEKMIPIVLTSDKINLFSPKAKIYYKNYWIDEYEKLEEKTKRFSPEEFEGTVADFKLFRDIRNNIGGFLSEIQYKKSISLQSLINSNYKSLLNKIGFQSQDLIQKLIEIYLMRNLEEQDLAIDEFIKNNPLYFMGYYQRGNLEFSRKSYTKALLDYSEAIRLNPNLGVLYNDRGSTNYKLRKYNEAIKDFNKALELDPLMDTFYYGRGTVHDEIDLYKRALDDYNKAIEINPTEDIYFNNRGTTYLKMGKLENAKSDYRTALLLNPQNLHASLNLKSLE